MFLRKSKSKTKNNGANALATKLANGCNDLAQHLQSESGYTVSQADLQNILQPFAQVWQEQSATSVEDLLEAGLDDEAAAYLVGWLSLQPTSQTN